MKTKTIYLGALLASVCLSMANAEELTVQERRNACFTSQTRAWVEYDEICVDPCKNQKYSKFCEAAKICVKNGGTASDIGRDDKMRAYYFVCDHSGAGVGVGVEDGYEKTREAFTKLCPKSKSDECGCNEGYCTVYYFDPGTSHED